MRPKSTFTELLVVWVMPPPVAVIVKSACPVSELLAAVTFNTEVPDGVTVGGMNSPVTPFSSPLILRLTGVLKPLMEARLTTKFDVSPGDINCDDGEIVNEKSPGSGGGPEGLTTSMSRCTVSESPFESVAVKLTVTVPAAAYVCWSLAPGSRRTCAAPSPGSNTAAMGIPLASRDAFVKATLSPASGLTLDITSAGIGGNGGSIPC